MNNIEKYKIKYQENGTAYVKLEYSLFSTE
jgi:hypothetical protein